MSPYGAQIKIVAELLFADEKEKEKKKRQAPAVHTCDSPRVERAFYEPKEEEEEEEEEEEVARPKIGRSCWPPATSILF